MLVAAVGARHDDDGLGRDLPVPLSRPRAASLALYVLAAFNRDDLALDRGRPEILRPRRALLGHAALRRSLIYGFTGTTSFAGIADGAAWRAALARPDLRPRVPDRRPRLQGLGRAVPHVDARRLRGRADAGHRLLRRRAQGRRLGAVRRACDPAPSRRWSTSGSRSSSSSRVVSMVLGAFAAIGQTNIKRLMAYSSIANIGYALMGLAAGTPQGVQGVLVYMAIYVAMCSASSPASCAMRRGATWSRRSPISRACRSTQPGWRCASRSCMFSPRPAFRRSPASSPSSTSSRPRSRRAWSLRCSASSPAWSAPSITCAS